MNLQFYRDLVKQHGPAAAAGYLSYRAVNRLGDLRLLKALVITVDDVDKKFLSDPAQGQFFDRATLKRLARDPDHHLTAEYIDEAMDNGERCYGFREGERLKSYGWYSTRPKALTELGEGLVMHFDPSYVYMYNGFTHPEHRGQRLHAIGMAKALEALTNEGSKGLIAYVDATNFSSLKSCARMGYREIGYVMLASVAGRTASWATPGCNPYSFKIAQGAPAARAHGTAHQSAVAGSAAS